MSITYEQDSFVPELQSRLRKRREELESEMQAVDATLAALKDAEPAAPKPKRLVVKSALGADPLETMMGVVSRIAGGPFASTFATEQAAVQAGVGSELAKKVLIQLWELGRIQRRGPDVWEVGRERNG